MKQPKQFKRVPPELLQRAKSEGVGIVHIRTDFNDPKGGLTVAFRKCSPFTRGSMVYVAVQTCSLEDTFSRSVGTTGALEKFYAGDVIQLPLLQRFEKEDLSYVVKQAFTALNQAI